MSFKPIKNTKLKDLKKKIASNMPGVELKVLLLDIEDAINIGSIIRSADGMGINTLFLSEISMKNADEKIGITSMGLHRRFDLIKISDISKFISDSKADGYEILGLDITADSINYNSYNYSSKILLVVGNERIGIYKKYFSQIDKFIHIPMYGKGPSLNAATAFAIVGFQIVS